MPGAQPRRDLWQKLATAIKRGTAVKAPGGARVQRGTGTRV